MGRAGTTVAKLGLVGRKCRADGAIVVIVRLAGGDYARNVGCAERAVDQLRILCGTCALDLSIGDLETSGECVRRIELQCTTRDDFATAWTIRKGGSILPAGKSFFTQPRKSDP